jgi:uncharacterized membrane protein
MIHRSFFVMRIVRAQPRLFSSGALGILITAALGLFTRWRAATSVLIGWDIGGSIYLALAFFMIACSDVESIRRRAADQDEGRVAILVLTVAAALASLAAIFAELGTSGIGGSRQPGQLVLASLTIVLSWAFIHTMFALHYAHEFYDESGKGGLAFPGGEEEPGYWDFVYFALVIGMTSQVSDVGVTSKKIRRTVSAHGVLSQRGVGRAHGEHRSERHLGFVTTLAVDEQRQAPRIAPEREADSQKLESPQAAGISSGS